jgi:hypothetical protein
VSKYGILINEELRELYRSLSTVKISRRLRWARHVARRKGKEYVQNLGRRALGRCPLGRTRRRCDDNIKIDLNEMGCNNGRWMELAECRVKWRASVFAVLNLWVILHSLSYLRVLKA